jgi:putative membrane protein
MCRVSYLLKIIATAVALWVTTLLFDPNIAVTAQTIPGAIGTLLVIALVFGLVNAIVKPVIKVVGCALYAASLGLFALVVNALLFLLVDFIAEQLDIPFHIENFWWALLGAVVVGLISWVLNLVIPDKSDRKKKSRKRR